MDTDDPPESGAASAPRSMALDFSPLKKQYRATVGAKERGELAAQFEDNVEEKKGLLERVAPNLKVRYLGIFTSCYRALHLWGILTCRCFCATD